MNHIGHVHLSVYNCLSAICIYIEKGSKTTDMYFFGIIMFNQAVVLPVMYIDRMCLCVPLVQKSKAVLKRSLATIV